MTRNNMEVLHSTDRNHHAWPALWNVVTLCGLLSSTYTANAVDTTAPSGAGSAPTQNAAPGSGSSLAPDLLQKPAWLTEASLTVKEGYDDNVFMAGSGTVKDQSSAITTVSPKVGFNFARSLDASGNLELLSFTYAPDFVMYHALPSENYDAHRMILAVKGKADAFSYSLDNTLLYIDSRKASPSYSDGLNAWGTVFESQRREQLNDKSKLTLQYDWDKWFIRPGASLAYYGMMTDLKDPSLATTPTGYQNYETRYDVNGGADFGYRFCTNMATTLGYRYGSQGQEQFNWNIDSSPSDYQRVLLGVEGKPFHWLNMQVLGGPDFRSYEADSATHFSYVNNLHPVTYYGEAALSATLTPNDTLSFKYKHWLFVSCLGVKPYADSSYGLCYGRKITDRLSLDLGARLLEADYNNAISDGARDDLDYILSAGLHYAFSANIAADLCYSANLGRNAQDNICSSYTRDFDSQEVTLAFQFKL